MDLDGGGRPFHRASPTTSIVNNNNSNRQQQQKVCYHWLQGKCTRYPCPYLHSELPKANGNKAHQGFGPDDNNYRGGGGLRRTGNSYFSKNNTFGRVQSQSQQPVSSSSRKKIERLCNFWRQGENCRYGDKNCKYLHQWSTGDCFSLLTKLDGHEQAVTGIAFPSGSDKLYAGSQDGTVRIWDCQSGQVAGIVNLGAVCLVKAHGYSWAWNIQTSTELSLNGPIGQVYSLVVGNDLLFAGTQDSTILAWKFNIAANCFEPVASLTGHTLAVVTLVVGGSRIYSGSMDQSIKVWSLDTLQCLQTLSGHTGVVMSVLCWDQFLLSASLDKSVKIWGATVTGNLEVIYTHNEEHGVLTLCGMHDSEAKPVLMCSCNDNTIRVYDLPSFSERAKIFSKNEVRSIQIGPGGLFFTGEGSGQVKVWKWSAEP